MPCSGSNAFPCAIFMGKEVLLSRCHKMQVEVPRWDPGISAVSSQFRERLISPSHTHSPLDTAFALLATKFRVFQGDEKLLPL